MSFGFGFGFPKNYVAALFNTPASLFTTGVNGAWYDPSDINLTWRRNLLTYSEQFDNAAWGKTANASVTANFDAAPDGSITADRFVSTGGAFPQTAQVVNNLVAGQAYTFSVWVKSDGTQQIAQSILLESGITTFIPTSTWTRVSVTVASSAGGSRSVVIATNSGSAPSSSFTIWGAQLELGSTATPYQRITDGIKDYLDYNPLPILYQDAAGTTPVTAVGQPVGLMLDKSKGLVLGPELVTNGDFSNGTTGWTNSSTGTATFTVSSGAATIIGTDGSNRGAFSQNIGAVAGRFYKVSFSATITSGAGSFFGTGPGSGGGAIVNGLNTYYIAAAAGGSFFVYTNSGGGNITIDNISVRELPGNHAFNPTTVGTANFPVLSAKYNLATETEFRNGLTDAPVRGGLVTATTLIGYSGAIAFGHDGSTISYAYKIQTLAGSTQYTLRIIVQMTDGNPPLFPSSDVGSSKNDFAFVIGSDTPNPSTATVSSLGSGVYLISIGYTTPLTPLGVNFGIVKYNTNSSRTFKVTAYDLRPTNDALNQPAYQRVNTATDYDTVGFKPYLSFNGVNQWLQTNSIDFTYGDKMFVSAGVRKLSDAAGGSIISLGSAPSTDNGSFEMFGAYIPNQDYAFRTGGTIKQTPQRTGYAAPITNVVSGIGNIFGDQAILRVNGAQAAISSADQGTGNYGNYPIYIGARAGSSLWFNGRLYGLVVAGKAASEGEISNTEQYLNQRTGAF